MIIEKRLILSVLVTLIPLAYTRYTSLWGGRYFFNDVIKARHHFHKPQHVQVLENPVDTRNHKSETKIVDINGDKLGSQNEQYQVENQGESEVVIVDINGNNLGSQNEQYQVENQQEPEIVIVDINGNVENLDNDKYEVGNEADHVNGVKLPYDYPGIQVTDAFGQQVDLQNVKYEVQDPQNRKSGIAAYPKVWKFKAISGNSIPGTRSENVYEVDSEISNDVLPIEKTSVIKTVAENENPEEQLIVDVSENKVDSDLNNDLYIDVTVPETEPDTENNIPETPLMTNDLENGVDASSYTVCQTVECRKLAQDFLSSMNKSVDPCEDFYEFACGGWESVNPKPSYEESWGRLAMIQDLTNRRVKAILETKSESDEILPVKQVKKWYQSCMDTGRREESGLRTIRSIMQQNGGWPMIMNEGEWHENEYTWQRVQRDYAHLTGSYTFYDIYANYPAKGKEFGYITIAAPKLSDKNDIHFSAIMGIAQMIAKYNRASVPTSRLIKESQELVLFQKALAKLIKEEEMENDTPIENLDDWYNSDKTDSESASPESEINLTSVVEDVFNLANITLRPGTYAYVYKYVKKIDHLLKQTPPRTIVNYIHWNFFQKMWAFFERSEVPRGLECVTNIKMKHAMSFAYVKKYYTKQTAESIKAQEMIENIRAGLEQKIENSNWMDSESKNLTKQKLRGIKNFLGFPEWYTNNTAIIEYYKGLEIGSDYLENHLSYMRYETKRKLQRFLIPEPENDPFSAEDDSPITVNALYDREGNFAEYTAAIFQPPFFGKDYPNAVKYGITGMNFGHEMSHAFDTCGITYGPAKEKTRLNEMILRSFYERVDCFVDQYDEYNGNPKVENGTKWDCDNEDDVSNKSDGQRTAGENIADNSGLEAVYQAYQKLAKDKYVNGESEVRLPGLEELTDNQLFFLSYAEFYCEVESPETPKSDDTHSIDRLRVIGPLSNTVGFAKAFNCPIGSPMNPVNKCSVWNKPDAKMNQVPKRKNRHSWHKH